MTSLHGPGVKYRSRLIGIFSGPRTLSSSESAGVAPLLFVPDNVAKENVVVSFGSTFGDEPRPVGIGREELGVDDWITVAVLRVEWRQQSAQLLC